MERIDIQNIRGQCKPADIITPYRGNYRSVWDNQEGERGSAREDTRRAPARIAGQQHTVKERGARSSSSSPGWDESKDEDGRERRVSRSKRTMRIGAGMGGDGYLPKCKAAVRGSRTYRLPLACVSWGSHRVV